MEKYTIDIRNKKDKDYTYIFRKQNFIFTFKVDSYEILEELFYLFSDIDDSYIYREIKQPNNVTFYFGNHCLYALKFTLNNISLIFYFPALAHLNTFVKILNKSNIKVEQLC